MEMQLTNNTSGDAEVTIDLPSKENDKLLDNFSQGDTSIRWHNVCVSNKPREEGLCCGRTVESRTILTNVFGQAKPGELLAIMGPSGSGKSTLLNVLTGRNLKNLDVDGVVMANGENITMQKVKELTGYVQQDTIFIATLTVREYLMFQSRFRIKGVISLEERQRRVKKVLEETGLEKCADTPIGKRSDELMGAGISGGEQKRLAFAAALLTNPWVLLCDEPTSGLDSALARNVIRKLKSLAETGRTIITTIHQPSSDVFEHFDRVLLLNSGRVVYYGSCSSAQEEFRRLGHPCPDHYNPADHYLKVISSEPLDKFYTTAEELEKKMLQEEKVDLTVKFQDSVSSHTYNTAWPVQFGVLLWRSWLTIIRDPLIMRVKFSQAVGSALILGVAFFNQQMNQKAVHNINGGIFMVVINMTFISIFSVINTFCGELPLFLREHNDGLYRVDVYILAKMTAELPMQVMVPSVFMLILFYMVGFYSSLLNLTVFMLAANLVANCGVSFGYLMSCLASTPQIATAISSPTIIPFLLAGGYFINTSTLNYIFVALKRVSWFHYGFESMMISQWSNIDEIPCHSGITNSTVIGANSTQQLDLRCLENGAAVLQDSNLNPNNLWWDIVCLFLLIVFMRLCAFIALYRQSLRR